MNKVGEYDATVIGVPFDGGTTYRSGTRFGPQGIRRISALYTPYNYEMSVDLREQMTLCDAGDVFTIPANLEKSFDQISNAVAHVCSTGSFPIILVCRGPAPLPTTACGLDAHRRSTSHRRAGTTPLASRRCVASHR